MKKFLSRLSIFIIPFPVFVSIVILIDPFNFFGISDFITSETKTNTSEIIHPQLWKMIDYKRVKTNKIILGDSRAAKVNPDSLYKKTGERVYNLAYPGGTLLDIIESFWYAVELQKLEEVYIGINFNLYNDYERNNNVDQAKSLMKNFITYSFNKVILMSMVQNIKRQFFVENLVVGTPKMEREEFWNYLVTFMGKRFYQKYKHPDTYQKELTKISNYCRENNIKLVFFMPATHVECQQRVSDFKLDSAYHVFIRDIADLGPYYNMDIPNDYTRNKANFWDPYHPRNDSLIVHTIWKN